MSTTVRAAIVFAVSFAPASAQTPDFGGLEKTATAELARLNIPGASIAIVRGETIIYSKGVGKADIETGEPVRPEMLFRLGSTTKMFTASALLGLAVEGKIDLKAPIGKHLTFLPPKLAAITADQLLSHTSGIRDDAPMYGSHDDAALGNGIRGWGEEWLFTPPGRIFSYSNPGYWVAGFLVETLTSTPYADAMETRVFKPLGMTRTTLRPTMAMTYPLAQGHEFTAGKLEIARPAADNTASWPAGSIFSNTHDLARFVVAFMNEGRIDGTQAIDPRVIALMSTPHAAIPGGSVSYCYGLESTEIRGVHVLEHGGSRTGYGSEIRMFPAQRIAVIVQTNRSGATLPETMEQASEMLVPMSARPAPAPKEALAITPEEMTRIAGLYQNGAQRIEVVARDNRLFMKRGRGGDVEMTKRGDAAFTVGNARFVTITGADGKIEYLHSGARSFARVP